MPYRHSLRTRLILSYPLLGAVVGLLLAGLLFFALESLEHQFMNAYVMGDLQYFIDNSNGATEMHSAYWVAYRTPMDKAPPGFESLVGLESGLHQIFERGKRGANVKPSGRGLGLAIASRLCEHFGWSLKLESPADAGVRAEWQFH